MPLANSTVRSINANGKNRPGAFPQSITALNDSTPELATARPYAVDLTGWFEGYSHPGIQDANGNASRIAPVVGVGSVENGALNILPAFANPALRAGARVRQRQRPGRRADDRAGRPLPGLDGARWRLLSGERVPV